MARRCKILRYRPAAAQLWGGRLEELRSCWLGSSFQPRFRTTGRARNRPKVLRKSHAMCRNIKTLYNFAPPATESEIRAASIQFVRKLSGFAHPSKANEPAFDRAVDRVTDAARELLASLVTNATPRDRDVEAAKAKERARQRFGRAPSTRSA